MRTLGLLCLIGYAVFTFQCGTPGRPQMMSRPNMAAAAAPQQAAAVGTAANGGTPAAMAAATTAPGTAANGATTAPANGAATSAPNAAATTAAAGPTPPPAGGNPGGGPGGPGGPGGMPTVAGMITTAAMTTTSTTTTTTTTTTTPCPCTAQTAQPTLNPGVAGNIAAGTFANCMLPLTCTAATPGNNVVVTFNTQAFMNSPATPNTNTATLRCGTGSMWFFGTNAAAVTQAGCG